MKVYVAGPMRGRPLFNFPAFETAAAHIRRIGHEAVSPNEMDEARGVVMVERGPGGRILNVTVDGTFDIEEVRSRDHAAIRTADAIYLLHGWETSEGARNELSVALDYGLDVLFETNGLNMGARA